LVLLNGAPGTGKSTIADLLSESDPVGVALDLDLMKHALPQWPIDPTDAGLEARALCLSRARAHLLAARNVYLGQYLAKPQFIEQLEDLTRSVRCQFIELILVLNNEQLAERIALRTDRPSRPEHEVNNDLVSITDVPDLSRSIETIQAIRPTAITIDASGDITSTLNAARDHAGPW